MDRSKHVRKPKVSVIMPVFNTEAFVEDAVRSIMNQTLKEIELIIIDDGSYDNSLPIIKSLALDDDRIFFFTQKNQGLSVARNVGLSKAIGQYIYFMDSDDILKNDCLMTCFQKCINQNIDFVFFDAVIFYEDNTERLSYDYNRSLLIPEKVFTGIKMLDILLDNGMYRSSVCLNFISHKFLIRNRLEFFPGIIHEDELFSFKLYLTANHVAYIPEAYYTRRVRKDSLMTKSFSMSNVDGYFTVFEQILMYTQNGDKNTRQIASKFLRYTLNPVIYTASTLRRYERWHILEKCIKNKYLGYLTIKTFVVLLFPILTRIKSFLKR